MSKSELRKIYIEKRGSLSAERRAQFSRRIADRFFDNFDLTQIKALHCFVRIEKFHEIDTMPIFERIWREFPHIRTLAPRVDFQIGEIENIIFTPETELLENSWGIREPAGGETVEPAGIDMVLVPLLCFDERGYRVGYGKGFYDRLLNKCRPDCVKIGLSFFPPVDEISDAGLHDVPLDYCITPEKIYRFSPGAANV